MIIPDEILKKINDAKRLVFLTGAGVSAESGIPTFRDAQTGLWAKYDPEELATPQAFVRNPKLVWEWYAWRRQLISQAVPNAGHRALAAIETKVGSFLLITQNIDGMHQDAGSKRLLELHGNIFRTKCSKENIVVSPDSNDTSIPPCCPNCGAFLRPDVVWFGEALPKQALEKSILAAQEVDVFISVGTSGMVQPAASLPLIAKENGAFVIEVNPEPTPLSKYVDCVLQGKSGTVLPLILKGLEN